MSWNERVYLKRILVCLFQPGLKKLVAVTETLRQREEQFLQENLSLTNRTEKLVWITTNQWQDEVNCRLRDLHWVHLMCCWLIQEWHVRNIFKEKSYCCYFPLLPANPAPAFIIIFFFFRYQIYFWYLLIYSKLRPIVDRILYQCKWNVFDLFVRAVSSNLLFRSCVRLWQQRYVFPGEDEVVSMKEVF